MRIIDKNHDFYDYLQDPTDKTIVFDRRGSFLLEKKHICDAMYRSNIRSWSHHTDYAHNLILVTCGAITWYFLATVTKFNNSELNHKNEMPEDFSLELLKIEKNYDSENVLIRVLVTPCDGDKYDWKSKKWIFDKKNINYNCRRGSSINVTSLKTSIKTKNGFEDIEYHIPLLRGIGITNLVNPTEVFCAIEEHFSRIKTESERTEAIGTTNDDKIIMHGFDTKTSFRDK